jgi:hypothetical protein
MRSLELIRRAYEVGPLVCPECGGEMRVVAFITDPPVIKKVLDHLARCEQATRAPPSPAHAVARVHSSDRRAGCCSRKGLRPAPHAHRWNVSSTRRWRSEIRVGFPTDLSQCHTVPAGPAPAGRAPRGGLDAQGRLNQTTNRRQDDRDDRHRRMELTPQPVALPHHVDDRQADEQSDSRVNGSKGERSQLTVARDSARGRRRTRPPRRPTSRVQGRSRCRRSHE